jgi:Tfp pilus assembly protein PilP
MGNHARKKFKLRSLLPILAAVMLAVPLAAACGDDSGSSSAPQQKRRAQPKPQAQAKKDMGVKLYSKVEDVVTPEEAKAIRHRFRARDFNPDPTGNEIRDPFRSYVVTQSSVGQATEEGGVTVATTEVCTEKNMVAPSPLAKDPRARQSYSLRDLNLAGIVLKGTRHYALFRDSGGFGHTVKRGDCLGKEKARVVKIGAGFVRLEVVPEPLPNQPAREPQKREIQLHPEELTLETDTEISTSAAAEGTEELLRVRQSVT